MFSPCNVAKYTKRRRYLYVKSTGGSGKVALRLIHLLRSVYDELIVLAPGECASAATMLALGADRIKMGPISYYNFNCNLNFNCK